MSDGGQEVRHWWPDHLDDVYASVKKKDYPIDWSKLHLSGYSMGARGCWRNAVARPNVGDLLLLYLLLSLPSCLMLTITISFDVMPLPALRFNLSLCRSS